MALTVNAVNAFENNPDISNTLIPGHIRRFEVARVFKRFAVLLLLFHTTAFSQQRNIKFSHIGTEEGLSQGNVLCILQDSRGFMWFGTRGGLNKYDGYNFTVYTKPGRNKNDISSNTIMALAEDASGNLWMATLGAGLRMFDRQKDKIVDFNVADAPTSVADLTIDSQGNLWLATGAGLSLFDREHKKFIYYTHRPDDPASISSDHVNRILEDSDHNLWVSTIDGLNLFDRKNKTFARFQHDEKNEKSLSGRSAGFIFEDSKKRLWVASDGLNQVNKRTGDFKRFKKQAGKNSLPHNYVITLSEDAKGYLWIGTQNGGLSILDPETETFHNYEFEATSNTSLSDNSIYSLYRDKKDNMWIGTFSHGLNIVSIDQNKFIHYTANESNNSLSNNSVLSFFEDSLNNLWISTDGGGINYFDRKNKTFTHYKHREGDKNSLCGNYVLKVIEDSKGNVWAGTWADGVTVFNRQKNTFKHFKHDPEDDNSLSSNNILTIYEDSEKNIWIGAFSGGLNLYNPETNNFTRYTAIKDLASGFTNYSGINAILEDSKGNFWVGSDGLGLCLLDKKSKSFSRHFYDENENSISSDNVLAIFEDSRKRLWIGTRGGLDLFDAEKEQFTSFHGKDGLPGEQVPGILEDTHGNLWLSTSNGISKFNTNNKTFTNFGVSDGLQSKEFTRNAFCKSRTGAMYFGGPNGFNEFFPDSIKSKLYDPPIVLTDFQLFNKPVKISGNAGDDSPLQKHISETKSIKLSHKASVISFSFASLNYTSPEKKQYAYMMEGFDHDWQYVGTAHTATYTNLDGGEYTFRVKGLNNQGEWSAKTVDLALTVTPPFWITWWFRLLVITFSIGCFTAFFLIRMDIVKKQKKILELKVEARTRELARSTEEERKARKEAEQANKAKSIFLATMSHEIRTPMNGVIGMASLLRETPLNDEQIEYTEIIRSSGESLLTVINDILDFSKIESGNMELDMEDVDLRTCIEEVFDVFARRASAIGLDLLYMIEHNVPGTIIGDRSRLRQVLINLVGNAIKFTSQGEIFVGVSVANNQNNKLELEFKVRDTGIGIPDDKLERLFKAFTQVDSSTTRKYGGTGLGLVISKKLVELMGGRINVQSEDGTGTTFTFTISTSASKNALVNYVHFNTDGLQGKKILVVDDNKTNCRILQSYLQQWKFSSVLAYSGEHALQILANENDHFDLIITDMQMPDMDGVGLANAIRQTNNTIPLILLSSIGDEQKKDYEYLFSQILNKPVKQKALSAAITVILKKHGKTTVARNTPKKELFADFAARYPLQILIAEDNPVNQTLAIRTLTKLGYDPVLAANGLLAIEELRNSYHDIVFMDVQMPKMDGLQATRHIRKNLENQPVIIAMTANAMAEDKNICIEAGMDDYISKPFQLSTVKEIIEKWALKLQNKQKAVS